MWYMWLIAAGVFFIAEIITVRIYDFLAWNRSSNRLPT